MVAPITPELMRSAIEMELARGGQVYFVHNRIDSIWQRAAMIQELFPQARIGVGHGQMAEAELEQRDAGFMRHEFDVFVSTTIVENGLDIPLANTMIIEHAERYGLSELYQLRGRVGRSNRRAYCYLLVEPDTELTEVARKRLAALKEFSAIWAPGFKHCGARSGTARRGQSAGRRTARAYQRDRLRHVYPDAGGYGARTARRRSRAGDSFGAESGAGSADSRELHCG